MQSQFITSNQFPKFSAGLAADPTTRRIWYALATAHDFESHDSITEAGLYNKIFASHFGQLSIIFLWVAGNLFHIGFQGNFEQWGKDPLNVRPIAHAIWDPHFGDAAVSAYSYGSSPGPVNISTSGLYQWWYTIGLRTNQELFQSSIFLVFLSAVFLFAGWLHLKPAFQPSLSWFKNAESRLNHHLSGLFGVSSLAWTGHLVHVAIPELRGNHVRFSNFLTSLPHPQGLVPFFTGNWAAYAGKPDGSDSILTFIGGLDPNTQSLYLTDIAHHHLAIAVLFILAGHQYRTNFGIGHSIKEILDTHTSSLLGEGHKGLYDTINNSLHFQLALALASVGTITSLVAQHYKIKEFVIAGFIMCGAFAHGAIFLVRDYVPEENTGNVLARIIGHKEAIISHLSWASLFLGFHTLGLYVHNDVMQAFGTPDKQILIEPIFAQWIQAAHGKTLYSFNLCGSFGSINAKDGQYSFILLSESSSVAYSASQGFWLSGWLNSINNIFLTIGPGDFLVHHAIALGLHTTTLILVKGALDARGSKLMPDKKDFGFSFPCDGPGRGGTCDISAWDAFYLAVFWMLNTIGWVTFYWHLFYRRVPYIIKKVWKHLVIWGGNTSQFSESSTYLMGWLRDYLWLGSSQLINGYNPFGMNSLSVWSWVFLAGHLVWATSFMFLISWRGYWQELIETLVWAHESTPIANRVAWRDKPVALSIVQARLVGLAHFSIGYVFTYKNNLYVSPHVLKKMNYVGAFLIASTTGRFG
uniref:photosystem I p700 apoprotein A2 n=1 Tax=Trentepohlia sp. BN17 TaxID=3063876 RepID=UPI001EE0E8D6|nr:photosystem I p700 apoprotein A2 [Trentepohlia sp. BN17]UIB38722.1 photosystem I p700 apoprotein A2 [Trentepohlia sp. BN17]